jgi:hypothetical protein
MIRGQMTRPRIAEVISLRPPPREKEWRRLLHLLFLAGAGVHMPVGVDESRHGCRATRVYRLSTGVLACGWGLASGHRGDAPAPHDDGALIDDHAVADDDPRVGDHEILRGGARGAARAGNHE